MGEIPSGWRPELLDHAKAVIRDDIARGRYFGAVIKVARGGKVGIETAIGDEGGPGTKALGSASFPPPRRSPTFSSFVPSSAAN